MVIEVEYTVCVSCGTLVPTDRAVHCACAKFGHTQHDPVDVEWCSERCMDRAHRI